MLSLSRSSLFSYNVVGLLSRIGNMYVVHMMGILLVFLLLRVPYLYGMLGFVGFIYVSIFPVFLSLFCNRIEGGVDEFFSSLLPPGTPLWIAPFVGLAETISYIVRPVVLMVRPFLNITIGAFGAVALGGMFISNYFVGLFLLILFFYEIFVAMVHWFIVVNILGFSIDH
uniref:ATP synthase F0 subunit 6 n=1 Tax=Enterogyrus malmbergi TaxID=2593014 RepID=A0A6M3RGQ2_9PLAT|nr:ATP synthase F0 subunit 6 [Enterogyrus malmbergi]QJD07093.1 ATP synthase F0 subunit 6 [Enterogyrus malmbergi]